MINAIHVVPSLLALLLLAKLAEIGWDVNFLRRKGDDLARDLLACIHDDGRLNVTEAEDVMDRYHFPKVGPVLFFTRIISGVRPGWLRTFFQGLFSYRLLVLLLSLTTATVSRLVPSTAASALYVAILVFAMLFQTFNLLWHQYILGHADHIQKTVGLRGPYATRTTRTVNWVPNQYLRQALLLLASTVAVFVISFACAYFVYAVPKQNDFEHLASNSAAETALNCVYYSVVTITTTGAGPTAPISPVARVLATAEVTIAASLLTVFVMSVSASLQPPVRFLPPAEKRERPNSP